MSASRRFLPAARVSLLALAMASPLAFAGHLNILDRKSTRLNSSHG